MSAANGIPFIGSRFQLVPTPALFEFGDYLLDQATNEFHQVPLAMVGKTIQSGQTVKRLKISSTPDYY